MHVFFLIFFFSSAQAYDICGYDRDLDPSMVKFLDQMKSVQGEYRGGNRDCHKIKIRVVDSCKSPLYAVQVLVDIWSEEGEYPDETLYFGLYDEIDSQDHLKKASVSSNKRKAEVSWKQSIDYQHYWKKKIKIQKSKEGKLESFKFSQAKRKKGFYLDLSFAKKLTCKKLGQ